MWRKVRMCELGAADAALLCLALDADLRGTADSAPRYVAIAPAIRIIEAAAELIPRQGLRAYDAIQLASAVAARRADPACASFACFDESLRAAASASGFELVPA